MQNKCCATGDSTTKAEGGSSGAATASSDESHVPAKRQGKGFGGPECKLVKL